MVEQAPIPKIEPKSIRSLGDIRSYLRQRESAFAASLLRVRESDRFYPTLGWEIVTTDPGVVEKNNDKSALKAARHKGDSSMIFTGKNLCDRVSSIIYGVLDPLVDENAIDLTVVRFGVDTNRENWDHPDYTLDGSRVNHLIIRAYHRKTREEMFFDPTYGQIDHRYSGRILIVTGDAFSRYYRTTDGKQIDFDELDPRTIERMAEPSKVFSPAAINDMKAALSPIN